MYLLFLQKPLFYLSVKCNLSVVYLRQVFIRSNTLHWYTGPSKISTNFLLRLIYSFRSIDMMLSVVKTEIVGRPWCALLLNNYNIWCDDINKSHFVLIVFLLLNSTFIVFMIKLELLMRNWSPWHTGNTRYRNTKDQHYWPFLRGIHPSPMDSPHKGFNNAEIVQLCNSLIITIGNGWPINEAGCATHFMNISSV